MGLPDTLLSTVGKLLAVGGGLGFAASVGAEPAREYAEDVISPFTGRTTRREYALQAGWSAMSPVQARLRAMRVQQAMAYNESVLASRYPDIYAKLLAGRDLPRGAVVYGGQPNRENVDTMTFGMATGKLDQPAVQ